MFFQSTLRVALALPWWVGPVAVSAGFLPFTFYVGGRFPGEFLLRPLSLGTEQGVGTWWSGILLLLLALLARSVAGGLRSRDPMAARGLGGLALVGLLLFADEIGSVHERAELIVPLPGELALLPFALGGGLLVAYSVLLLARRREGTGGAHWLVCAAFGLFAVVYLLERAEHELVWAPGPGRALRLALEEGLELAGMLLLIGAVVRVQRSAGVFRGNLATLLPSREALLWLTRICVVASLPALALRSMWSAEQLRIPDRGDFGTMIPVALLIVAALLSVRAGILDRRHRTAWSALAAASILASIDLQCHLAHYLWHQWPEFRWRSDFGLLWSTPLLILAALQVLPRSALGGLALGYLLVVATVLADAAVLALVTPYPIAFGLIYAVTRADTAAGAGGPAVELSGPGEHAGRPPAA